MKFKQLEEYQVQREKKGEVVRKLQEEAREAQDKVEDLKRQYEELMHKTVVGGEYDPGDYKNPKLIRLHKEIEKAEITAKVCRDKLKAMQKVKDYGEITKQDLLKEFNNSYTPKFKEEKLKPVLQEMENVKVMAEELAKEYQRVQAEFEAERNNLINVLGEKYRYKPATIWFIREDERQRYCITDEFTRKLKY